MCPSPLVLGSLEPFLGLIGPPQCPGANPHTRNTLLAASWVSIFFEKHKQVALFCENYDMD